LGVRVVTTMETEPETEGGEHRTDGQSWMDPRFGVAPTDPAVDGAPQHDPEGVTASNSWPALAGGVILGLALMALAVDQDPNEDNFHVLGGYLADFFFLHGPWVVLALGVMGLRRKYSPLSRVVAAVVLIPSAIVGLIGLLMAASLGGDMESR
jgi:hypothetical protein